MKRLATVLAAILTVTNLWAVRHCAIEAEVCCRCIPADCRSNVAFSPVSAEIDCIACAEALSTIARATVAEEMGVLSSFEEAYRPIIERFAAATNGFAFCSARGFCLPQKCGTSVELCQLIRRAYGVEAMPSLAKRGIESWFRTSLNGAMEDFAISRDEMSETRYSFYDLVSVQAAWLEPFSTSAVRRLAFNAIDGSSVAMDFLCDVRQAESWRERNHDVLRLPLSDACSFYALLPREGVRLADVREALSAEKIDVFLTLRSGLAVNGQAKKGTLVVLPKFAIDCRTDLLPATRRFKIPMSSLAKLCDGLPAHRFQQRCAFRIEAGEQGGAARDIRAEDVACRFVLNRPFLYFIYDDKTGTIPVMGQFTGISPG